MSRRPPRRLGQLRAPDGRLRRSRVLRWRHPQRQQRHDRLRADPLLRATCSPATASLQTLTLGGVGRAPRSITSIRTTARTTASRTSAVAQHAPRRRDRRGRRHASTPTPAIRERSSTCCAVQKTSGAADSMIELDSANALEDNTPRTFPEARELHVRPSHNPASPTTPPCSFAARRMQRW